MTDEQLDWREKASCRGRDPEVWFDPARFETAKAICCGCSVTNECRGRVDALERLQAPRDWFGVWSAESPVDRLRRRKAAARQRRRAAAPRRPVTT